MKNFMRSMLLVTAAALLVTSASVPSSAQPRQVAHLNTYDGEWSVVIYTLYGDCDRALRYSVRIVDGRVVADQQNYQVAGLVNRSGAIRVVVAEGGRSASGSGRLSGSNGRGSWRTDTGQCSGQWTAVRRG